MRFLNVAFILSLAIFVVAGCSKQGKEDVSESDQQMMEQGNHSVHSDMEMRSGEPSDESIYNVSSSWKNRYANRIQLDSLRGKIQVVAMVYTHCEYACPRILADMKRIRDALSEEALKSVNFVIVSIDPKRDTPERLLKFAEENELNDEQWTLLNGETGDILELSALLGVKYKKISETDFTHSNMITVLNREGEIVHQRKQLGNQPTDIINTIETIHVR
ncbi:MAG: SCO family protein [Balneolaceae bacterium]|nr:SCO family protein [Balneolaceae bacterium]